MYIYSLFRTLIFYVYIILRYILYYYYRVLYPHHFMLVAFSMHFVSDRSKHRTPIDLVPGTDDVDLAFEMIRIGTQCCYVIQQTTYAQRQSEIGGTENECQLVTLHSLSLNIYFLKILRQNSALLQGVPDSENKEQPKRINDNCLPATMHAAHTQRMLNRLTFPSF